MKEINLNGDIIKLQSSVISEQPNEITKYINDKINPIITSAMAVDYNRELIISLNNLIKELSLVPKDGKKYDDISDIPDNINKAVLKFIKHSLSYDAGESFIKSLNYLLTDNININMILINSLFSEVCKVDNNFNIDKKEES